MNRARAVGWFTGTRSGPSAFTSAYSVSVATLKTTPAVLACCWFLVVLPGGCSKEKLKDLADTVQKESENLVKESKKMTDSLVETAKEQLPETGSMLLKTEPPLQLDRAVIRLHVVGDGRKNSLQITSYVPGAPRISAPAVFLYSTTEIESVALLAGKSLPCTMFVESDARAAVAKSPIDAPVSVTFGSLDVQQQTITASVAACTLTGSDQQPLVIPGAEILAVVLED